MNRVWVMVVVVVGVLAMASSALAAQGDPSVAACLTRASVPGCSGTLASNPLGLALSPDGKQLYASVAGGAFTGLQIFDRDPTTGTVTPRPGAFGCYASAHPPCTTVPGLSLVIDLAASPDGKSLYVGDSNSHTLFVFARDPASGILAYQECFNHNGNDGCTAVIGNPPTASAVAVSPDNQNVYLRADDGLAIFDRDTSSGLLVQKPATAGCVSESPNPDCSSADGLADDGETLRFSPNGDFLYVPFDDPGGVSVFKRAADGTLSQTPAACWSATGSSDSRGLACHLGRDSLATTQDMVATVSPDGRSVYAGSDNGVTSFDRDSATGLLTPAGCIGTGTGCTAATPGVQGVFDVAVTPDNGEVMANALTTGALAFFTRDPSTGALTQRPAPLGCMTSDGSGGSCQVLGGLAANANAIGRLAIASDGLSVYATSSQNGMLATIRREAAPTPPGGGGGGGSSGGGGGGGTSTGGAGTAIPVLPTGSSSNAIRFGKVTSLRNGTAVVEVIVDGPGTLLAQDASTKATTAARKKKKRKRVLLVAPVRQAVGAGTVTAKVTIKPSASAKRTLKRRGRLGVRVRFTYMPTGGTANSATRAVTLKITKPTKKRRR